MRPSLTHLLLTVRRITRGPDLSMQKERRNRAIAIRTTKEWPHVVCYKNIRRTICSRSRQRDLASMLAKWTPRMLEKLLQCRPRLVTGDLRRARDRRNAEIVVEQSRSCQSAEIAVTTRDLRALLDLENLSHSCDALFETMSDLFYPMNTFRITVCTCFNHV